MKWSSNTSFSPAGLNRNSHLSISFRFQAYGTRRLGDQHFPRAMEITPPRHRPFKERCCTGRCGWREWRRFWDAVWGQWRGRHHLLLLGWPTPPPLHLHVCAHHPGRHFLLHTLFIFTEMLAPEEIGDAMLTICGERERSPTPLNPHAKRCGPVLCCIYQSKIEQK
jgi:hypothetical protein